MDEFVVGVTGRGSLTGAATVTAEGVLIRLDDDDSPSFWCEIGLSEEDLRQLLKVVEKEQEVT